MSPTAVVTEPDVAAYPVRVTRPRPGGRTQDVVLVSLLPDDDPDHVLLDGAGRLVAEPTVAAAATAAAALGHRLEVDDLPDDVDLDDALRRVSARPDREDCTVINDAVNILTEVCRSLGTPLGHRGADAERARELVFWGTGILRRPEHEAWQPSLSPRLQRKLRQILRTGTARLDAALG